MRAETSCSDQLAPILSSQTKLIHKIGTHSHSRTRVNTHPHTDSLATSPSRAKTSLSPPTQSISLSHPLMLLTAAPLHIS